MRVSSYYDSPVGRYFITADDDLLIRVSTDRENDKNGLSSAENCGVSPVLRQTYQWFEKYFSGMRPDISSIPIAPLGSRFEQEVWRVLTQIPYGTTTTYGDIAQIVADKLGKPRMAPQAVGGAIGRNPIAIIIPCHRVIGANGHLTGYAGGLERKRKLLEFEGVKIEERSFN